MAVTIGTQVYSSGASTYDFTVPTVPNDGSLLIVAIVSASSSNSFTPSGGPTLTTLSPTSGTSSQSGHASHFWTGVVDEADSADTIVFTQSGGTLKAMFVWAIVSDPHATPIDTAVASTLASGTSHVVPASTTGVYGCVELQFVFDSRGASTPNTSSWTKPESMEDSTGAAQAGTTALCSGAVGYNDAVLNSGTAVGSDTWTFDQAALGSAWTISLRTSAAGGDPTISYSLQKVLEVDATGSSGGTVSLAQTDGPTSGVSITESPTGFFRVEYPSDHATEIELTLSMTGDTDEVFVIQPVGAGGADNRYVYNGTSWVQ